ncbi:MAG: hypothetical protein WC663_02825 [Patescibacteria group bacterium]
MRKTLALLLAILAISSLVSCKKEVEEKQIEQDVNLYYINLARRFSSGNLNCTFTLTNPEQIEKLTRDEKAEIKVRISVNNTCTPKESRNSLLTFAGNFEDGVAGRRPGVFIYQQCLTLSYEIFDEGFKLRNISVEVDANCPESEDFKAIRKTNLETALKETALASCYCKHHNCDEENSMDNCGISEVKDLNSDGIDEVLVSDTCHARSGNCYSNLWSIVDESPKMIFESAPSIKDVQPNTDGNFPMLVTTDSSGGGSVTKYFNYYDSDQKKYVTRSKKVEKVRRIDFIGQEDSEVFISGERRGVLKSVKPGDSAELTLDNLPSYPFKIEIKKPGFKTFTYDWDWNSLPRVFEASDGSGYINQELEKE